MTHEEKQIDTLAVAGAVIDAEIEGLRVLRTELNESFTHATRIIAETQGYVIVSGVGKSGHIGRKIVATLASTGSPSFFVHPTEASHGDLGMVRTGSTLIAISNSGESAELRDVVIHCRRNDIPIIAITRNEKSFLGRNATVALGLPNSPEACPNGLAPTTSTTATLALGDALAIAAMSITGFTRDDFGMHHPAGALGLQLQRVQDWMLSAPQNTPTIDEDGDAAQVVSAVTEGQKGCVAVVNKSGHLIGVITDGDLRRAMDERFFSRVASDIMTPAPRTIEPDARMGDVIKMMVEERIAAVFVVEEMVPVAALHVKDLMQRGYM